MEDIAKRANVSRATVSFVLNRRGDQTIRHSTVENVWRAARDLGYHPNRVAQVLAGAPTYQIQLCARGVHPGFYSRAVYEFEQQINPTPYDLRIVNTLRWSDDNWTRAGAEWPVDGLILFDSPISDSAMRSMTSRKIPIVSAGVTYSKMADNVGVLLDNAVNDVVKHLLQTGRKRIAHVTRVYQDTAVGFPGDHRYSAYAAALAEANLTPEVIATKLSHDGDRDSTYIAIKNYIKEHGCPEAIFCMNDEMVIAAYAALFDLGIRVPQEVALVGCDGIEETEYHRPMLSTIAFPFTEVAHLACKFLFARIEQPSLPPQSITLSAKFQARESSY